MPIKNGQFIEYEDDGDVDLEEAFADTGVLYRSYMEELMDIVDEIDRRQMDSLSLYQPQPFQERYHSSKTRVVVMRKGNRCGGQQPLTSHILTSNGMTVMGSVKVGDTIIGGDGKACQIEDIFEYGMSDVYRFTFSDGTSTESGLEHNWTCMVDAHNRRPKNQYVGGDQWKVLTTADLIEYVNKKGYKTTDGRNGNGRYKVVFPSLPPVEIEERAVLIDPYTLGVLIGDGNFTHTWINVTSEDQEIIDALRLPEGCEIKQRDTSKQAEKYGKSKLYSLVRSSDCQTKENPLSEALKVYGLKGCRGHEKRIPREYLNNSVNVRLELLRGLMDTDGRATKKGNCTFYTTCEGLVDDVTYLVRSLGGSTSVVWRDNSHRGVDGRRIAHVEVYGLGEMNPFKVPRKAERYNLRANKYPQRRRLANIEYIGRKQCRCIQVNNESRTYVTDQFIVTHNSLAGYAEDARCLLNRDPYNKYPQTGSKTVVCIGYGEKHIANVIYRYLFMPGAFKIIRDMETLQWRVFRPWGKHDPESKRLGLGDAGREKEAIQAPPFIPPSMISGKPVWVNAGGKIFSEIRLKTGWKVIAANSNGDPNQLQGIPTTLCHVDEDVANPQWIEEQFMRLVDDNGYLRWTAMAHGDNEMLSTMYMLSDEQAHLPEGHEDKFVECIQVATTENYYLPKAAMAQSVKVLKAMGEDVYRKRILGDQTNESVLVYDRFSKVTHSVRSEQNLNPVTEAYINNGYYPPSDWCIYTATDPGHKVAATLFLAVPPPDLGKQVIVFDEIYLRMATAILWGLEMAPKCRNLVIEDNIIDMHGGRITSFETGEQAHKSYSRHLEKNRIASRRRGYRFGHGCDNIESREESLRQKLSTIYLESESGPGILIDMERCPNLTLEMTRFKKHVQKGRAGTIILNKANRNIACHAVECLEYLASHPLEYVKPLEPEELRVQEMIRQHGDPYKNRARNGVVFGQISMTK